MAEINPGAEAGRQAKELHRLAFPGSYPDDQKKEDGNPEPEGQAPEDQAGADAGTEGKPEDEKEHGGEDQKKKGEDTDYWRKRFDVMQGKYNAEVPRLTHQVSQLTENVNALTSQLQSAQEQQQQGAVDDEDKTVEEALEEMQERYGDRFIHALNTLVNHAVSKAGKEVDGKLDGVEKRVQEVESTTTKSQIDSELDRMFASDLIPDWRVLNNDPGFIESLKLPAPFSGGKTLHDVLKESYYSGDVAGTAEVFCAYSSKTKQPADQASKDREEQNAPKGPPVSPTRRGGSSQVIEGSGGDIWKVSDYEALLKTRREGKISEEAFQKKKAEFYKAREEGRLIG